MSINIVHLIEFMFWWKFRSEETLTVLFASTTKYASVSIARLDFEWTQRRFIEILWIYFVCMNKDFSGSFGLALGFVQEHCKFIGI